MTSEISFHALMVIATTTREIGSNVLTIAVTILAGNQFLAPELLIHQQFDRFEEDPLVI